LKLLTAEDAEMDVENAEKTFYWRNSFSRCSGQTWLSVFSASSGLSPRSLRLEAHDLACTMTISFFEIAELVLGRTAEGGCPHTVGIRLSYCSAAIGTYTLGDSFSNARRSGGATGGAT
jgi:hypothetical protein